MKEQTRRVRVGVAWCLFAPLLTVHVEDALGQDRPEPSYQSRFVEADGLRLHYLDFGGEGLPILFLHSKPYDAYTYEEFASRFADRHRVLAPTFRGSGKSGGKGADVPTDGEDLLYLMDALRLEEAVLIGNSTASLAMTYLAEHHPDRIAGLVYLTPALPLGNMADFDTTRIWEMTLRAQGENYERSRPLETYRPDYLRTRGRTIDSPAMVFRNRDGGSGLERLNVPLLLAQGKMPVRDSTAKAFFERFRENEDLLEQVDVFWTEFTASASRAQKEFDNAFSRLEVVRLELPEVWGYEYREAPLLIEPHIRSFLEGLEAHGSIDIPPAAGTGRPPGLTALDRVRPGGSVQAPADTLSYEVVNHARPAGTMDVVTVADTTIVHFHRWDLTRETSTT